MTSITSPYGTALSARKKMRVSLSPFAAASSVPGKRSRLTESSPSENEVGLHCQIEWPIGRSCASAVDARRFTRMSTVASGAATMKMISSTSIASINGVTLISCISSSVSSPWSRRTLMTTHSSTLDSGQWRRPPRGRSRHDDALEVAADEPQDLRRGIANPGAVAPDRPREPVVHDPGGNGAHMPACGGQLRFGDPRRDNREVGGMRLRDADEAVHDAPDGTKQADEGGGRTNGGKHAGAAQDPPPVACFDAL